MKKLITRELLIEKFERPTIINIFGTMFWLNECGQIHRDGDKPAVVWPDGSKCWLKNGERHRDKDKPAVIYVDSCIKEWFKNGIQYFPR